jgi:hypothetical protein
MGDGINEVNQGDFRGSSIVVGIVGLRIRG